MSRTNFLGDQESASFGVAVLVDGDLAPLYHHSGQVWVESISDARFEVEVANLTSGRVLVKLAVDGLDVLDAGPAALEGGRGAVVDAGSSYRFRGWRISDAETRSFVFAEAGAGVSSKVEGADPGLAGQIGVAVFAEAPAPPQSYTYRPESYGGYDPGALKSSPQSLSFDLGVRSTPAHSAGIGAARVDRVRTVEFRRGDLLWSGDVRYRSRAQLEAMGLLFDLRPTFAPAQTGYAKLSSTPRSAG